MSAAGVPFVDALPFFDPGLSSTDYFLAYDPMHFSELGHRVMADVVASALGD